LFSARRLWLALAFGGLALVAGSVALTDLMKLHPCYLCVFQRLLYLVLAGLALLAALARARRRTSLALGALLVLAASAGLAVAGYQVWLQVQPSSAFSCAGAEPSLIERLVDWLDARIPILFRNLGDCASKELVILNLSLAGWSCIGFAASLGVACAALWRRLRETD
jgi:disulfide bond formation protein DsbB